MTSLEKSRVYGIAIVISLLSLIFLPPQIPIPSVKTGFVAILGIIASVLQFIVLRQTANSAHRKQSIVLLVLTIVITTILLLI